MDTAVNRWINVKGSEKEGFSNFVCHLRYEFVEIGNPLVDVNHMSPVALCDLRSPFRSGRSLRSDAKALIEMMKHLLL